MLIQDFPRLLLVSKNSMLMSHGHSVAGGSLRQVPEKVNKLCTFMGDSSAELSRAHDPNLFSCVCR